MAFNTRNLMANHSLAKLSLIVGLLIATSSGCSMFQPGAKAADSVADANAIPVPEYRVKIYGNGKPQQQVGKLDRSKTVQTVLEETGAIDEFTKMEIVVGRRSGAQEEGGGEGYFKLESDFDSESRQVVVSQDYAIYPGDVIVIRKDSSTALDGVLEKFSNAFGG